MAVFADPDEKTAKVVVPDYQLSLAIGKEGQNARLAARLTGYKIDIKSETQAKDAPGFRYEDYLEEDYGEYEEEYEEYEDGGADGYGEYSGDDGLTETESYEGYVEQDYKEPDDYGESGMDEGQEEYEAPLDEEAPQDDEEGYEE